jgi:hypothetical protein
MNLRNFASSCVLTITALACSASGPAANESGGSGATGNSGSGASGGTIAVGSGASTGINVGGNSAGGLSATLDNPKTCTEAAENRTYVGCEFWPTITANPVYVEFLPAVVIANAGDAAANVTVTGPNGFSTTAMVPAKGLQTVNLEWVMPLKGPEFNRPGVTPETSNGRLVESTLAPASAFKLTSDIPVTVWQFNPLSYELTDMVAASNDASLLLPTTAMTGDYRIFSYSSKNEGMAWGTVPGGAAITATSDVTEVRVQLGPNCGFEDLTGAMPGLGTCVAAGSGVEAKNAGDVYTLTMNAGDVLQLVGAWSSVWGQKNADISGSVVNADKPVQVVSFNAISMLPDEFVANADHMEEIVLPAQVLGTKYVVAAPSSPNGAVTGHVVRIYGNVDGTQLTYTGTKPAGAPDVINAGEVVQIPPLSANCSTAADHCAITAPFVVEAQAENAFAINSFMLGGKVQHPTCTNDAANPCRGDPSHTMMVAPEQFRKEYTFLAPADFVDSYADVIVPAGAELTLDGAVLSAPQEAIAGSEWAIVRAKLDPAGGGVHTISTTDDRGLGLQVAGFGNATSFYYPGGLNLKLIAPPPVIPR